MFHYYQLVWPKTRKQNSKENDSYTSYYLNASLKNENKKPTQSKRLSFIKQKPRMQISYRRKYLC